MDEDRRKVFASLLAGAAALPLVEASAQTMTMGKYQSVIELYRSPVNPLTGPVWGWWFPDVALSANTAKVHFSRLGAASIQYARWLVVWNPNTSSTPQQSNGIKLISFDYVSGGQIHGYNDMGTILGGAGTAPVPADLDVTSQLQNLLASASDKQLGHIAAGDGVNGIRIYGSWIEVVWG